MNHPIKVKPRILLVDDEERILRTLTMLLKMQYQVFSTTDGNEALKILKTEKIHVLISDQSVKYGVLCLCLLYTSPSPRD